MGANVSQEVSTQINSIFNVVNNTTETCVQRGTQTQNLSIQCPACPGGTNVTVSNITFNESAVYNTSCSAAVSNNTQIQQDIQNQVDQTAKAIAQQFQLSQADASQVTKILTQISNNITNATVVNCVQSVAQNQGLEIFCPENPNAGNGVCNITVTGISYDERFTPINNCLLQQSNSTGLVQQITNIAQQSATAEVESLLGPLLAIIIVIALIVGVVVLGGPQILTDWRFWLVIIVLVFIYLGLAYWRHWFPFEGL